MTNTATGTEKQVEVQDQSGLCGVVPRGHALIRSVPVQCEPFTVERGTNLWADFRALG